MLLYFRIGIFVVILYAAQKPDRFYRVPVTDLRCRLAIINVLRW